MALTDTTIRNAKPKDRLYKLYDGKGLFLEVTPKGGKRWRFRYRRPGLGKENLLSLGLYPDVPLKEAREKRDHSRAILTAGQDPGEVRREAREQAERQAADSFEAIAREWFTTHLALKSPAHKDKVIRRLEREVFPYIGRRPVAELKAPEILRVVRRVEQRGYLETARRALQHIGQVLRYAIATGRAEQDPTQALRRALAKPERKHMAAPVETLAVGGMLRTCSAFSGSPAVTAALKLLPLLFVRPGELRTMRWEDVDMDATEWRYTTSKTGTEHLVPLSRQAIVILEDLRPLTGHLPGGWVFPGGRSPLRPMSNMAINAAYRRLGIDTKTELTGHGWRATARTLLHEQLDYPPEVIEHQLAHAVPDTLGRAYNRTKFLDQRREMMQAWADYLDKLRDGAEIVPLVPKGKAG